MCSVLMRKLMALPLVTRALGWNNVKSAGMSLSFTLSDRKIKSDSAPSSPAIAKRGVMGPSSNVFFLENEADA